MIKKAFENIKNKNLKITFKYNQDEIVNFCKNNIAVSILITLAILFIAIGNSFVVGALIGGYIAAKQNEKLDKTSSSTSLLFISTIVIGAIFGGTILMLPVVIGRFFHPIGSVLGIFVGGTAIIAFLDDLIKKLTAKLQKTFFMDAHKKVNEKVKKKSKKHKLHKKSTISKKRLHLRTT